MNVNKKVQSTDQQNYFVSVGLPAIFIIGLSIFCRSVGYSLIIPLLIFFLGLHLFLAKRASIRLFINMGLLLTLIIFICHTITFYSNLSIYYVPVAGISMLVMLLYNSLTLAFTMTFAASIITSLILGGDFGMMLTFFLGGLAGMYSVRQARTRGQLLGAGLFVSVIHGVCVFLLNPYVELIVSRNFTMGLLYPLVLNGFISALLVAATLKVFEYLFGVLTNYSLLELSDFNQPLLKRMILEAPGTYHHSLVVSNLAEAAADAIGAHSLLTRVGAYYHDIGKMSHPEYFTENQLMGGNKHDNIEPSMSRLVILNHVKEGIELAKKHKLNPVIIDFIPQHHGTSLIYYFYQKSLEGAENEEAVSEETFRYPGPKPQTRETAITLLADSVEGATRALDDPNPTNIEETVQKVINNKFIDGQLDECPLTLKEIDKISSTFVRILTAMYHGRVKYPEKKNGTTKARSTLKDGHNNREPSEKNSPQSQPDQKNNKENPSS